MNIVRAYLFDHISRHEYIVFSTSEVLGRLRKLKFVPGDILATIDIEGFFMAAEHCVHVNSVACTPGVDFCKNSVEFLLGHQFAFDPLSKALYQVIKGSGMGSQLSSDLCDFTFWEVLESRIINPDFLKRFGIKEWLRYRDDVLCVATSAALLKEFLSEIRRRVSGIWKIEVEQLSRTSVSFLDLEIFVTSSGTLGWRSYSKPSKVFVPLHSESAHHPRVHFWPVAEIGRIASNSSSLKEFSVACTNYVDKLICAQLDGDVIANAIAKSHVWPICRPTLKTKSGHIIALVLPFH